MFKREKYEIIIVDTSGRHRQEAALFDEMQAKSLVSKLLGFGDISGLMKEMKAIQDQPGGIKREEMIENLKKGKLTLRDMQRQFESVSKMGPMSKMMGMIPGIP